MAHHAVVPVSPQRIERVGQRVAEVPPAYQLPEHRVHETRQHEFVREPLVVVPSRGPPEHLARPEEESGGVVARAATTP